LLAGVCLQRGSDPADPDGQPNGTRPSECGNARASVT
jgi:hypothetical protein